MFRDQQREEFLGQSKSTSTPEHIYALHRFLQTLPPNRKNTAAAM
jgi:hypothetical protein